jgi:creatinine amidohydrolase
MPIQEVNLERMTRREVREGLGAGHFQVAVIATGSIEQHLEHLALVNDIASSTYVAERAAERLHPDVIVAVPMSIGIAEHHMFAAGTLTAKPGSWAAVLFDAVESLVRHGITKILILNGHVKNAAVTRAMMPQWKLHLERDRVPVDLRFFSYWELIPKEFVAEVQDNPGFPGHATEFETSITMHVYPQNVRPDAIPDSEAEREGPATATPEKGKLLVEKAIDGVAELLEEMLRGEETS